MSKQDSTREKNVALYSKVISTNSKAELKGATMPYTSLNGHMYSYFSKDGFVALRLPEEIRVEFLEKYKTTLVTAYGIVQKEYVVVPDKLLAKTSELKKYFDQSYKYVSALKPKPTAKSKKK